MRPSAPPAQMDCNQGNAGGPTAGSARWMTCVPITPCIESVTTRVWLSTGATHRTSLSGMHFGRNLELRATAAAWPAAAAAEEKAPSGSQQSRIVGGIVVLIIIIAVVAGCGGNACGSSSPAASATRYSSAAQVVAALKHDQMPCTGGSYDTPVVQGATSETQCNFDSNDLGLIDVFPDNASTATVLKNSVSTGTQQIFSDVGPNWGRQPARLTLSASRACSVAGSSRVRGIRRLHPLRPQPPFPRSARPPLRRRLQASRTR